MNTLSKKLFGCSAVLAFLTMAIVASPFVVIENAEAAKKKALTAKQVRSAAVKKANSTYKQAKAAAKAKKAAAKRSVKTARADYKKALKTEGKLGNARLKARNVLAAQHLRYLNAEAKAGPGQNRTNNPALKSMWDKLLTSERIYKRGIRQQHVNAMAGSQRTLATLNQGRKDYTQALQDRLNAKRNLLAEKANANFGLAAGRANPAAQAAANGANPAQQLRRQQNYGAIPPGVYGAQPVVNQGVYGVVPAAITGAYGPAPRIANNEYGPAPPPRYTAPPAAIYDTVSTMTSYGTLRTDGTLRANNTGTIFGILQPD